jgi:hypothetical protein
MFTWMRHDGTMAKKKQKPAKGRSEVERELKAQAKKLRAQLAAAEKSAEKWKARAKDHRSVAVGAKAELAAVRRRLEKAETPAKASSTPDDSWNVTRLRAEARSRGVAGYSRKTRAELLDELGRHRS